jgi:hypothetical protein
MIMFKWRVVKWIREKTGIMKSALKDKKFRQIEDFRRYQKGRWWSQMGR